MRGNLLAPVKKIQSYSLQVMAGFIVGFDHDPEDIFERQIQFIRESAIPLAMVGLLRALPDTQLWRRLAREGRLLLESTGNNTDGSLNFVPKMDTALSRRRLSIDSAHHLQPWRILSARAQLPGAGTRVGA